MMRVDSELCKGCGACVRDCPVGAIELVDKKAVVGDSCVSCGVCVRVCKHQAPTVEKLAMGKGVIVCRSCPVQCNIPPGFTGACKRYVNSGDRLERNRPLVTDVPPERDRGGVALYPLITGVGAGTNYPCCRPAPYIVQDTRDGVEVVTVVTEAPLSYSGVKLKIDTNCYVGEDGARVRREGHLVGMVDTEEYGSKMLYIGGANLLTGRHGFTVARTIVDLCNGEQVRLKIENGADLDVQVGQPPVVDGVQDQKMRVGCGSATIGMFAWQLAAVVDEAIILDHHVVGLLSEHLAGEEVGMKWSGVVPKARKSTRGRYFGEHGRGWGGTDIVNPRDAIAAVDMSVAGPGIKILVTETTGQQAALFTIDEQGEVVETPMTPEIAAVVRLINDNCEQARVSALYVGGTGGSARAGVTNYPIKLSQAVHAGEARLSIGGAPAFILPGGGINFMVDVERVVPKAFTWVPTPATVAPVEYTMTREQYAAIGGHVGRIVDVSRVRGIAAVRKRPGFENKEQLFDYTRVDFIP
jgi:ferredoxin